MRTDRNPPDARLNTQKHAATLQELLTRMQAAASAIAQQDQVDWGHAGQMRSALEYTVYAAFALGVVSEAESHALGFPC